MKAVPCSVEEAAMKDDDKAKVKEIQPACSESF
jgi:hypothetical protein